MAPPSLLGPPQLYLPTPPPSKPPQPQTPSDPFMKLMEADSHEARTKPPMGRTENGSATFLSSGNPCLDFFFHVVPDTPPESLKQRLRLAWDHNPLTTLKLICNLRGVRGTGKSDKEGFFTAASWLHQHHPKTLACNLDSLADFGCFKDLPEMLYRLLEGSDIRKTRKEEWSKRKLGVRKTTMMKPHRKTKKKKKEPKEADMKAMKSNKLRKIGLASKWCPSVDSAFDKSTLLCEGIAKKMFTRKKYPEYVGMEEAHYAYKVRDRLRKEVLVPLHKVLELPEVYIGANQWDLIPYNRVASVAMKFYKEKFLAHDKERFSEYLEDVKAGKSTITAGALLPHEIIASLQDKDGGEVAELQWQRMVNDLLQKGKLRNCMAICDVSGSMKGIPMEVSVALGVLVSELSEEPWKGKLITFSKNPKLQMVEGETLEEKTSFVENMDWGMNTDFQKVFRLILKVAVKGKLKPEQMIKRLFVFSDMEFDRASANSWETDYQKIVRKFTKKGYGESIPQIVFWNLRDSKATPVPGTQNGVALVSGFSKNLLKMFLDQDGDINPEAVMEAAISGEEYQKLVVLD
ncbi:hypothetical protein COLO4_35808 [Corchorus olitorius]|uniref:von Willebrand factor, type A n=1 Tax=Corchorus olitorius TaxID=93759 RepID=A0A1R3GD89_9ROSI|nr:hypothetical protein COLO4_35808 [Corchorus olitorius]